MYVYIYLYTHIYAYIEEEETEAESLALALLGLQSVVQLRPRDLLEYLLDTTCLLKVCISKEKTMLYPRLLMFFNIKRVLKNSYIYV
jgi:hypothetical protein